MAKKNSSKTATKEALQAAEPRVMTFTGWQGVNFREAPLGWNPMEGHGETTITPNTSRQMDERPNFLLVQNNLVTCDSQTLETRPDSEKLFTLSTGYKFTGVATMWRKWILASIKQTDGTPILRAFDVINKTFSDILLKNSDNTLMDNKFEITEIGVHQNYLIVLGIYDGKAIALANSISYDNTNNTFTVTDNTVYASKLIPRPTAELLFKAYGGLDWDVNPDYGDRGLIHQITLCYVYTNRWGTTTPGGGPADGQGGYKVDKTIYVSRDPIVWTADMYLSIASSIPSSFRNMGITGVDIYAVTGESQVKIFIGHVDIDDDPDIQTINWTYPWLGSMTDTTQWLMSSLNVPKENTTQGPQATHFASHDSRLYYWGNPEQPYTLYIGGDPGNELSIARGVGGAWVDIEPGSGYEVAGTAKWKTTQGSNIVTIMTGNVNTNKVKRFNLIPTNMEYTNEVSKTGYMYEEVSNVVGCNSRWGYGVFGDGLYSISRYGVILTTMAMEYNNQMRSQSVSDTIQPIFTERLGNRLKDARLVAIDDVIYIVLSEESHSTEPVSLDRVILCYDLNLKAWYTFTHDGSDDLILHAFPIDSEEHVEGLGIITESEIWLYPTTGIQDEVEPEFNVLVETGELSAKQPVQSTIYLSQLEFRFDYFIGNVEIEIEGTDYYGRQFKSFKKISHSELVRDLIEYVRIDRLVESYRIRILGKARFRLISINAKLYAQSNKIGLPYGFDSHDYQRRNHGKKNDIHHYIRDYNDLRDAIVT